MNSSHHQTPTPEAGASKTSKLSGIPVLKSEALRGMEVQSVFEPRHHRVVKSVVLERVIDVQLQLDRVLNEADAILHEARREAAQIRADAHQEGLKQGHEEVLRQIAVARAEYGKLQDAAQGDMLTLAFGIARRVIGKAIELSPGVVDDIVSEQLEHARGRRQVTILVHPDDLAQVEASRGSYATQLEGAAVYFGGEPSIERGGCIIETESGRIDARLEIQLAILRDAIERGR